jgi:GT2 family glycosyltransferase
MPTLSVVIVTHHSALAIERTVGALVAELRDGDELIVVDNESFDETVARVRELAPGATVIETGANLGFSAACNRGAEAASGELLCLLNPDAVPDRGWRDAIERPLIDDRSWAAWQALVTAENSTRINTWGGVVHFTGISWAGGAGEPIESIPTTEPGFVSGACLAIERRRYLELGGMPDEFFLYHEDVDLSLRARLAGGVLGLERTARVDHDYDFTKGAYKWRLLERNRWATLIRTYPGALLTLLAPGLIATELALVFVAAAGGWLPQKVAAWADIVRWLPRLLRERRAIQAGRVVSAGAFARSLTAGLDSSYLGAAGRSRVLGAALGAYWRLVLVVLGRG